MNDDEKLRLKYEAALNQYNAHPPLVWTRNNFFLLIQSGLLAFTVIQNPKPAPRFGIMPYIAGLFIAIIWFWVNLVGQKLLRQARSILIESEKAIHKDSERTGAFDAAYRAGTGKSFFYSITSILNILSGGFVVFWLVLIYLRLLSG